jgi:hypothetical protein
MFHRAAVVAVIFCLNPVALRAQEAGFRIDADSASIHLSPSTGSPVIGRARRGDVLEVAREIGSWLKIAWPEADGGVAYVHVSTGSRTGTSPSGAGPAPATTVHHSSLSQVPPAPAERRAEGGSGYSPQTVPPAYVATPAHVLGVGGRIGPAAMGSGASLRTWLPDRRVGLQLEVSRSSIASTIAPGRLTVMHMAPSVLYALPDRVTDYVWVRPYLGAGPRFLRQTVRMGEATGGNPASESRLGVQVFGGGELTFATLPSFALSAGLHYGWLRNPTAGFELEGLGVAVAGHWYVR